VKILVWASFYPPHVGGYEKNVAELSRRLVQKGHQVAVVTCKIDDSLARESVNGVIVHRVPCKLLLDGLYPVPYLPLRQIGNNFDVSITQTRFFPLSFLGALHSVRHKIPLIHVERGSRHPALANRAMSLASRLYDHTIGNWIVRTAQVTVGVSDAACEFARHLGARRVVRIPNGVTDTDCFQTVHNNPTILYVGRLIRAKGVQDLIAVCDRIGGCDLIIAGDGPYRRYLQSISDERPWFCGSVSGNLLNSLYHAADVFVNPSYSEGLPTSVMEAAVAGVPIVATDVGGTREIVQHGVTGRLVKPHDANALRDAIIWTLNNKDEARQRALKCREYVLKEFSWDKVTDRYCTLLASVCAK